MTSLLRRLFLGRGWTKAASCSESPAQLRHVYSTHITMTRLISSLEKSMCFVSGLQQCFPWGHQLEEKCRNALRRVVAGEGTKGKSCHRVFLQTQLCLPQVHRNYVSSPVPQSSRCYGEASVASSNKHRAHRNVGP